LHLDKRKRVGIDIYVIVDIPELRDSNSFSVVDDKGEGENVASNDFCLEVAAREIELSGTCLSVSAFVQQPLVAR
jgi:hypothetical protein